ncbi:MAG TPA: hypothetical protein VK603_09730 [Candidatus Saccharimonadales bacterium]|nr:hypothetical protein [Candidatus Saccharimonadales bacterium]
MAEQRPAATDEDRADDELILVDQAVLRELRNDRAAAEEDHVFARLVFQSLDLVPVEFVKNAGILPRRVL